MKRQITTALAIAAGALLPALAIAQTSGGILRTYLPDDPPSGSIHEESSATVVSAFSPVFNNLVMFDPREPINTIDNIVPDLATEWSWNDARTELTFTLPEGVTWHDGAPVSTADVKCTWDMLRDQGENKLRSNPRKNWYDNLSEVVVNSATSVTFKLDKPQPSFIMMLASDYSPVYPCHVATEDMRKHPIGTGAFRFVSMTRGQSVTLEKNPDYFKEGLPYLDGIEFTVIGSRSTRILAFGAGKFDTTYVADVSLPQLEEVQSNNPEAICTVAGTGISSNLLVNRESEPFNNPDIRTALAYAIDRTEFIESLGGGGYSRGGAMLPAPEGTWAMPEEMLTAIPGYGNNVEANRAEARKIMESLGYTSENPLAIKIATRNSPVYRDPAIILLSQLREINVVGELDVIESSQWFSMLARKDYQIALNMTGVAVDDPDVALRENYSCGSQRNYSGYCNPEIDAMIDQQSQMPDGDARRQLVWEIDQRLQMDVARPTIYFRRDATCYQPYVKDFIVTTNSNYNGWHRYEYVWLDK